MTDKFPGINGAQQSPDCVQQVIEQKGFDDVVGYTIPHRGDSRLKIRLSSNDNRGQRPSARRNEGAPNQLEAIERAQPDVGYDNLDAVG
nr:hypothetical protein [Devosia enhydra]